MPFFTEDTPDTDLISTAETATAAPTRSSQEFASSYTNALVRTPGEALGAFTVGSVLDLADTIGSSVIPGVERNDINENFLNSINSPGLTKWFNDNRGAVEAGSGIAGTILADYVAGRILKPGSVAMQAIRELPYAKRIATLDAQFNRAKRIAQMTQEEVAARGLTGADRFLGGALNTTMMGVPVSLNRGASTAGLFKAGLSRSVARNLTTEAVMATTLHTNNFLYSDELSHNLAWGAAGLAIGGAFDSMITAHTLRKMANSETIRQLNRGAYDVSGFETQRLHAFDTASQVLKAAGVAPNVQAGHWRGSGGVTDLVSSIMIQAAENKNVRGVSEQAVALGAKREQTATHLEQMAFEEIGKPTTRGIRGVAGTGFGMNAEGLGSVVQQSLYREPTWAYGLEEIGHVGDEMTHEGVFRTRKDNIETRLGKVQKVLDDGGIWSTRKNKDGTTTQTLKPLGREELKSLELEAQELTFAKSLVPKVMLEPGEWAPLSHAKLIDGYSPRGIKVEGGLGPDNRAIWQTERTATDKTRLGISSDGEIFLPDGVKRIEMLDPHDMLDMYRIGRQAVKHFAAAGEPFIVPKKPNWFQLDMAEQIIRATDNPAAVQWPDKLTRETALVESFAQKVDAFRRRESNIQRVAGRGVDAPLDPEDVFRLKVMMNLPRIDNYTQGVMANGENGVDALLGGFKSGAEVRQHNHADLLKSLNDVRRIQGFTEETADSLKELHGNSFNFMMDENGNAMKPIIGFQRPMQPLEWTRDDLFVRQATKESLMRDALIGDTADPITREITGILTSDPSFGAARKVMELADDQGRSFIPGFRHAAPQTTMGSLINAVTSRARRDVDNPTMLAASAQQDLKTRITQRLTKEVFDAGMGGAITEITSSRNARSLMLMNNLMSHGHGWEFADDMLEHTLPDGGKAWGLVLDHESVLNQKRFREAYGRELQKGQNLLDPNGKEIVLDQLARDVFLRTQDVHKVTLDAKNTLLRSQNLPEINRKNWYLPPPSMKGKYVAFTFDMQNNVVPGMTIIANSPDELTRMTSELAQSPQWKQGYRVRSRDDVTEFMTLWDKAQMDFVAPNVTAIQPKKHNYGLTAGNKYNNRAFEEALVTMRDSLIRHGDDILEVLHDDVLKAAKVRAKVARVESAVGRDAAQHSSIYDRFNQNLTGRNSLGARDSFFGDLYGWLESRINGALNSPAAAKAAAMSQGFNDFIRAAAPGKSATGEQFNKFSQELGNYMPFKSAAEMIERRTEGRMPPDVAGITSKLSWFEAASRLRWFESMHAVVNIGSILANTPAVIRALQPRAGESIADAALRNSSLSMTQRVGDAGAVNLPNVPKLLWESMRDAWKKEPDEFTRKAFRMGYMDQEVAEFNRAWGAIDSKAGWRGFMFGNEAADPSTVTGKIAKSGGIDKWLGVLSDKSEGFTRQWGMYAGRRVAKAIGIDDVDAQVNFAHEITNKLIANYDPRNRPEIFQGALGAPIGLFQSYIFNFYERMFRYIETGDKRSLATQMAMQAGLFGTGSVPGWDALNWAFFDHGQAKGQDPVESIYNRFGTADGDLIMHGVLSNLPKIFGAEGINLYTRGDASVRLPGTVWTTANIAGAEIPLPNLPVIDTLKRVASAVGDGLGTFAAENGSIGPNHLAEIAANMMTNRPIAGLIETVANRGFDTSMDGQVVAQSKSLSEKLYRVLGVRSMAQQKQIDQFYASKTAQEEQAARRDLLLSASRAAVRAGKVDQLDELFAKYVEQGGDPRYYTRWKKNVAESALHSRSERMLDKALKDKTGRSQAYIGRLLDGQVDVDEDERATDDYGRNAQIEDLVAQSWATTPNPTGSPTGEEFPGGNPNQ